MNEPFHLPVTIATVPIRTGKVDIVYPQVTGLTNYSIQHHINQLIIDQMHSLLRDQHYYENKAKAEVTGFYEIKTNERGILSLTQTNYTYVPPAANGLTIMKSLTFDIRTGHNYQLHELFKPGSDYIKKISDNINVQIQQRNIQLVTDFVAIAPDQDYYIADKALVVYFQMYEYTPRYFGLPAFPISVYELQDIINEDGPLGKMIIT